MAYRKVSFKNRIQIGTLTYDIYGYIDQANNLGVREYVLVEGLEELDPENLPLLCRHHPSRCFTGLCVCGE